MEYSVEDSAERDLTEEEEKIDEIYKQQSILSFLKGNSKKPKTRNDHSFQEKDQDARCTVEQEPKFVSKETSKICREKEQKRPSGEVEYVTLNECASKKLNNEISDFVKSKDISSLPNTEEVKDDLLLSCEENKSEQDTFAPRRGSRKKTKQIVSENSESSDWESDVKRRKRKKKKKRIKKDVDNEKNRKEDSGNIKIVDDNGTGSNEQAKCDKEENKRHDIFSDPKICNSNEIKVTNMDIDDVALNGNEEKPIPSLGKKGTGCDHIIGITRTTSTKAQNIAKLDVQKHPSVKESTITMISKAAPFPIQSHVLQLTANEQQWYENACKTLSVHNISSVDSSTKASYFAMETKSFCRSLVGLEMVLTKKKESCIQQRSLLECISDLQKDYPDYLICNMLQNYLNCQKNILKQCVLKAEQSKANMKIIWEKQEKPKTIITVSSSPEKTPQANKESKNDIRALFGRSKKIRDKCRKKDHDKEDVVEVSKVSENIDIKGSKEEESIVSNSRKGKKKKGKNSKSKDHIEIDDTCVKSEPRRTSIEEMFKNASKKPRRRNMKEEVENIQDHASIDKENSKDMKSVKKEGRRSLRNRNKQKECDEGRQEIHSEGRRIELVSSGADEERMDVEFQETTNEDKEMSRNEKKKKKSKSLRVKSTCEKDSPDEGNGMHSNRNAKTKQKESNDSRDSKGTLSVTEDKDDSKPRNKRAKKKAKDRDVIGGLEELASYSEIENDEKHEGRENEERTEMEDREIGLEVTSCFVANEDSKSRAKKKKSKKLKKNRCNEDVDVASSYSAGEKDEHFDTREDEQKPEKGDSNKDVEEASCFVADESELTRKKKKKKRKSKASSSSENVEMTSSCSTDESNMNSEKQARKEKSNTSDCKEDLEITLSNSAEEGKQKRKKKKKKKKFKNFDSNEDLESVLSCSADESGNKHYEEAANVSPRTIDSNVDHEVLLSLNADDKEKRHKKKKKKNKLRTSDVVEESRMTSFCSDDEGDRRRKSPRNSRKKKAVNHVTKRTNRKEEESSLELTEHGAIEDNSVSSDSPKNKKGKSKKNDKVLCSIDEKQSGKKNTSLNEQTDKVNTIDIRTMFNNKKKSKDSTSLVNKVEEKGVMEVDLDPELSVDHKAIKYEEKPIEGIIMQEEKSDIPTIEISIEAEKQSSGSQSVNLSLNASNINPYFKNVKEQDECDEMDNLKTVKTDEKNQGQKRRKDNPAADGKHIANVTVSPVETKSERDISDSLKVSPKNPETNQSRSILSFFKPVGQTTRQKKLLEAVSASKCEMQPAVSLSEQIKKEFTTESAKPEQDHKESIKIKDAGDDVKSLEGKKTDAAEDSGTTDMHLARCGNKRKRTLQIACNDISIENPALSSSVRESKRKKLDKNSLGDVSESGGHKKQDDVNTETFTKLKDEKVEKVKIVDICQPKGDSDEDDPVMEIHRQNMSDCMSPNIDIPLDKSVEKLECKTWDNESMNPETNNDISETEPVTKTPEVCTSDAQSYLQVTDKKSDSPLVKEGENKKPVKVDVSASSADASGSKDAEMSCRKDIEPAELILLAGSKISGDLNSAKGAKRKRLKSSNDVIENMDNCERRRSKRVKDKQEKMKETATDFDTYDSAGLSPKKKKTKRTREIFETMHRIAEESREVSTPEVSSADSSTNQKSAPESTVVVADKCQSIPSKNVIEEEPVTEETVNRSLQWTDKYSPIKHDDVIGNKKAVEELFFWLSSWKEKHEHFVHLMSVNASKNARSRSKHTAESDSDDDFYDSSEEEEDLLNTFIIIGKTGCGSTAAVYACAQELGYKVLELNPSIYRTGKQIQSLLGEATQSHQVKRKFHGSNNDAVDSTADDLKGMKSLSSFFGGKSGKGDKMKCEPKTETEEKDIEEPRCKENLNASRAMDVMSVILLEQADLVFDDLDKGFWLGVNELRSQTKRPIVITANDSSVASQLDSRAELIKMNYPTKAEALVHLQVMCLAEHVFPSKELLSQIITSSNCDIRQSIMQLQFLLDHWKDPMCKITISDEISKLNSQEQENIENAKSCCEIQSVDETTQNTGEKNESILTKDETVDAQNQCLSSAASKTELCSADHHKFTLSESNHDAANVNTNISCNTPVNQENVKQSSELKQPINVKNDYKSDGSKTFPSHKTDINQDSGNDKKKKLMIDIIDVGDVQLDQPRSCSFDIDKIDMQQAIIKKWPCESYYVPVAKKKNSADNGNRQISEIELISASYDDLSHIDIYGRSKDISDSFGWWSSKLKDGLTDSLPMNSTGNHINDLNKWHAEVHLVCRKLQESSLQKIGVNEETPVALQNKNEIYNVLGSAEECLPLTTRLDHRATIVDVIPSLKSICLMEENRRLTQFKRRTRRFLHYLDGLLLQLDSDLHENLVRLCLT